MILEIEYFLLSLLLVLMYVKPRFLKNVRKNSIMKILLMFITIYMVYKYGSTAGLLMGCIFILLLNDSQGVQMYKKSDFEGFASKNDPQHYQLERKDEEDDEDVDCEDCRNNITDLSREFELNTERNLYNYRHVNNN